MHIGWPSAVWGCGLDVLDVRLRALMRTAVSFVNSVDQHATVIFAVSVSSKAGEPDQSWVNTSQSVSLCRPTSIASSSRFTLLSISLTSQFFEH
ncbi:hypothetical protein T4D_2907 [Trichinella pseudospiralis]|uniref:Uncharacterized protein n=1 Tax=Trichinella pseudospiralis TaxID=6337 RepID=A0A0V1FGT3_TRIPS|nr:hypothetical protein T4D_2907 [Trichinella pseudospiralis]